MIVALAGRRIDAPDAEEKRFPLEMQGTVYKEILKLFQEYNVKILVSSAACGADLLAQKAARKLKIERYIILPFGREKFRETSVIDRPGDWGELFDEICDEVESKGNLVVLKGFEEDEEKAYSAVTKEIFRKARELRVENEEITAIAVWEGKVKDETDETVSFIKQSEALEIAVEEISTVQKENSILEKIRRFLFGDDIFISYSRIDSSYALALANELSSENYNLSCFLDQWGTPPGEDLPEELINTINRCSTMVVVGSKHAAESDNVGLEVKEFLRTKRPIIPITFGADELVAETSEEPNRQDLKGTLEQAKWFTSIKGIAKATESLSALKTGEPSEEVILRIFNAAKFRSRRRRLRRTFFITLAATIALILFAIWMVNNAAAKVNAAETDRNKAQNEANAAIELANEKTAEANKASARANAESNRANTEANRANEKALIANIKTEEANKATKLADEKDKLAQEKTKLAEEQTKIADAKRKEADEQTERSRQLTYATNMQLGARLYDTGKIDQLSDLLKYIKTPDNSNLLGFEWFYLNHLTEGLVNFNASNENIDHLLFSSKGDLVTNGTKKILVWNPETGKKTELETGSNEISDDAFSPDGNLFVACVGGRIILWNTTTQPWTRNEVSTPSIFSVNQNYTEISYNRDDDEEYKFVSFLPNNKNFLTVSLKKNKYFLEKWDAATKKQIEERAISVRISGNDLEVLKFAHNDELLVRYNIPGSDPNTCNRQYSLLNINLDEKLLDRDNCKINYEYYFFPNSQRAAFIRNFDNRPKLRQIQIWDTNVSKSIDSIKVFDSASESGWKDIVISNDGKLLAALDQSEVRIWDTTTTKIVRTIRPANCCIASSIAFSPDGSKLVVGGYNNDFNNESLLALWDVQEEKDVFTFKQERPIAISSDGTNVITQNKDNLNIWDTLSKNATPLKKLDDEYVKGRFSPDNLHFIGLFGKNGVIQINSLLLWKVEKDHGNNIPLELDRTCKLTENTTFSSDGKKLVELCRDGSILVLDTDSGKLLNHIHAETEDLTNQIKKSIDDGKIDIFQAANQLVLVFFNGTQNESIVWDTQTGTQQTKLCNENIIKLSTDGRWQITFDKEDNYHLRNDTDKDCAQKPLILNEDPLEGIAFSPDNRYLAAYYTLHPVGSSGALNPTLLIKNLTSGLEQKFRVTDADNTKYCIPFLGEGVQFSKSNRWVQFGNYYFDLNDPSETQIGRNVHKITSCVQNPVFSSDESRLITNCGDGTLKFISLISGQEVLSLKAHDSMVSDAVVMQNNKYLLTASRTDIKLWRIQF